MLNIDRKGGQLYENYEKYDTAHKNICVCSKKFSYPREVLQVKLKGKEFITDLEGYLMSMKITGQKDRRGTKG